MVVELPKGKIAFAGGRGLPLRGDNIDTDHMYPARFLKELDYSQVVDHFFYDERFTPDGKPKDHPFNDQRYKGAAILLANSNLGCGSGRDQGAHAFVRIGLKAIVAESYAELFLNACIARGLMAVRIARKEVEVLMQAVEKDPATEISVDLEKNLVTCGKEQFTLSMPENYRTMMLTGNWDLTAALFKDMPKVRAFAEKMPYLNGFKDFG